MTEKYESPDLRTEMRMARDAADAFRADLIDGAFAFRPLPPWDVSRVRWVPRSLRRRARWLPHALILLLALFLLTAIWSDSYLGGPTGVMRSVVVLVPLLLLMFRPVAAFWVSLGLTGLVTVVAPGWKGAPWPWAPEFMIVHLLVILVVAGRSRPRVAPQLWLVTGCAGVVLSFLTPVSMSPLSDFDTSPGHGVANTALMVVLSAVGLGLLLLLRGWRESRRQVVEQVAVVREERSRRTLLEERTTIARELHDVVAHHMSVVAIQAEAARYRVEDPPEELVAALGTIRENAVAALTELRRVLGVVRADMPTVPEAPQPTLADLDTLLDGVRAAGLGVRKATTGAVRALPPGVELSAYRIVQEALSNTLRHAPGAPASVELSYVLGGLGLRVVNEAPDTAPQPSPGAGHGLLGMRERAAMLDGVLTVGPTGDGGWAVEAFLPVPLDPDGAEDVAPGGGGGAGARVADNSDTKELSGAASPADRTEPAP